MYSNLFAPNLPDWQSFKRLNENKNLSEAEMVQKYKKLQLSQDRMIEESIHSINQQNEALINAQGGGGSGAGASRNTAQITGVVQYIGAVSAATGYYRYTEGFTGASNEASIVLTYNKPVRVSGGIPVVVPNSTVGGGGSSEVIFSYQGAFDTPSETLTFAYSQSAASASSIVVATSQVDTANNSIEFTGAINNFKRGNKIQYSAEGGTVLTGLTDGGVYYVLQGETIASQFSLGAIQPGNDAETGNPFYTDPSTLAKVNLTGTGNSSQTFKCLTPFIAAGTVGDTNGTFDAFPMTVAANLNSGSFSGSFSSSLYVSASNRLYISASGLVIVSGTVNSSRALTDVTASMTSTNPVDLYKNMYLTVGDTVDLPNNFFGNQNSGSRITLTSAAFLTGSLNGGGQDTLLFRGNSLWTADNGGSKYFGAGGNIVDDEDGEYADLQYDTTVIAEPRERTTLNT